MQSFLSTDPYGKVLFQLLGETHRDTLFYYCDIVVQHFKLKNQLQQEKSLPTLKCKEIDECLLKYPGKIAFSPNDKLLAISDSGHHRILIANYETASILVSSNFLSCESGYTFINASDVWQKKSECHTIFVSFTVHYWRVIAWK